MGGRRVGRRRRPRRPPSFSPTSNTSRASMGSRSGSSSASGRWDGGAAIGRPPRRAGLLPPRPSSRTRPRLTVTLVVAADGACSTGLGLMSSPSAPAIAAAGAPPGRRGGERVRCVCECVCAWRGVWCVARRRCGNQNQAPPPPALVCGSSRLVSLSHPRPSSTKSCGAGAAAGRPHGARGGAEEKRTGQGRAARLRSTLVSPLPPSTAAGHQLHVDDGRARRGGAWGGGGEGTRRLGGSAV